MWVSKRLSARASYRRWIKKNSMLPIHPLATHKILRKISVASDMKTTHKIVLLLAAFVICRRKSSMPHLYDADVQEQLQALKDMCVKYGIKTKIATCVYLKMCDRPSWSIDEFHE